MERFLIVIALCKENIFILGPVYDSAHAITRFQRLTESDLFTAEGLCTADIAGQRNLMLPFKIKGLICRILTDRTDNACLTCLGSRKQPLVSGQRDMQGCCALHQRILINLNIRVSIILETGATVIHHLDGLRNHRTIIVLSHRYIQAGNDIMILLQFLIKRTGICSTGYFPGP